VQEGTESAPQTVTLTNSGGGTLNVSAVSTSGAFAETDNCVGAALLPGESCSIQVSFLPTAIGATTGTLTVTDNATGNPQSVSLSGTGDYGFAGLFSPYSPPSAGVAYKAGSSVPLKWQYTDGSGNVVASSDAAPTVQIYAMTCSGADTTAITVNDTGNSGYQYDATTNTWQFNWKTTGLAQGCYNIYIQSGQSGQSNGGFPIQLK
jgi:hypothetical protein